MNEIIKVKGLTKKYGDFVAVDNLSFNVVEGEIFGFLGPNGAGKSTTLNVLTTLLTLDRGEVYVDGYDLRKDEKVIKSLIGLVPQDIAVYDGLTAYENVAFFASLYGLSGKDLKKSALDALEFVGLSDHKKTKAKKMSGGMKRRLNIACGIAHNPRLIVMDEPTVGVDAQSRDLIMNSIRILRDRGATIIYTSHYMPEVQEICDRIAIIDKGRLAAIGSEEELLEFVTDFKTIYLDTELPETRAIEILDKLRAIPDVKHVSIKEEGRTIKIDVPLTFTTVTPILRVMMDAGLPIDRLDSEAPNLETTFLALTGSELS